jgi:hypothetical protein
MNGRNNRVRIAAVILAAVLLQVGWVAPALAQSHCVTKEYAQYKDQLRTADGRWNLPLDYCMADIHQGLFDTSSTAHAECAAEMSKMRDAMVAAGLSTLVKFAEARCEGAHPLAKAKKAR